MKLFSSNKKAEIKKLRREATLERSVATALGDLLLQIPALNGLFIVDLKMSKKSGLCIISVASIDLDAQEEKVLSILSKIKGQVRTVISKTLQGSWTPDVVFRFDSKRKQVNKVNQILADVIDSESDSGQKNIDSLIDELKKTVEK